MKALTLLIISLFVGTALAAEPSKPDFKLIFDTWKAGYAAKDVDKVLSIYTKDLKYSYQGIEDIGYAGLRDSYITDFKDPQSNVTWTSILEETHADANLAVIVSSWTSYSKPVIGRSEVVMKIRSIDMLRLTKDGWKIFRTINYPEP